MHSQTTHMYTVAVYMCTAVTSLRDFPEGSWISNIIVTAEQCVILFVIISRLHARAAVVYALFWIFLFFFFFLISAFTSLRPNPSETEVFAICFPLRRKVLCIYGDKRELL